MGSNLEKLNIFDNKEDLPLDVKVLGIFIKDTKTLDNLLKHRNSYLNSSLPTEKAESFYLSEIKSVVESEKFSKLTSEFVDTLNGK